jgi:hypothetical protein
MLGAYKQVKDKQMETEPKLTETEAKLMCTETEAKFTTALQRTAEYGNQRRQKTNEFHHCILTRFDEGW